jgi:hypothetical protein
MKKPYLRIVQYWIECRKKGSREWSLVVPPPDMSFGKSSHDTWYITTDRNKAIDRVKNYRDHPEKWVEKCNFRVVKIIETRTVSNGIEGPGIP